MKIQIHHLFNHPQHIRLVAQWIYAEFWKDKAGYSAETFETLLRQADNPDRIPLSLIALADGQPAGTVNLVHTDSEIRPDLHPWLAALVVVPEYRHFGIGSALVRALMLEAKGLGFPELYLGTDIPEFYSSFGAEHYQQVDESLSIMRLPLG